MNRPYYAMRTYAVIWNFLFCLILGPFAPWFGHLLKLRREGRKVPGGWFLPFASFIIVYLALWTAPVRWEFMVGAYLLLGTVSFIVSTRAVGWHVTRHVDEKSSWGECLALAALVVYPVLFGYGLLRDINGLRGFSIHLPSSVYIEALLFAARFGTPSAILLAFLVRRSGLKSGLQLILHLYIGAMVLIFWIGVCERLYPVALYLAGIKVVEPLLFDVYGEASLRSISHGIFYAGGILLGVGYLACALNTRSFVRRSVWMGVPVFLGYANLILLLGEGGYFLSGLRDHLYREGHYNTYRTVAKLEIARLPNALHVPGLMMDLGELAILQGRGVEAAQWHRRILRLTHDKPYFNSLRERVLWEDNQQGFHPGCIPVDSMFLLPVPRARFGATLDGNWYGLLSAVSFFRPGWSDFDLKKKLLELSPDIQLSVSNLGGVPSVAEALDVFGIPFSPCFLDSLRLHDALRQRKIPFLNIEGRWVPVVGWDPCRKGFLCYRYPDSLQKNPWFDPADKDAVFNGGRGDSISKKPDIPYNLIAFVPERDLLQHLHDIGGVALILGDSTFASSTERRAAYLTELGDVLYQEHDDNEDAAKAYAKAQALHPSDYILARMVYLERRNYGWDAMFREEVGKEFSFGLDSIARNRITGKILDGGMGQYLLLNWHEAAPRFFAGKDSIERDSARTIFQTWLRLQPNNPVILDSLATVFQAQRRWDSAEVYCRRELGYYPLGNEYAAYRLAWNLFQQEHFEELDKWLDRSESFQEDAHYLLMQAALDWHKGRRRAAVSEIRKSLKLDKTLSESHKWMERMALAKGDSSGATLNRRWQDRTRP